ncbi:MAG: Lar family restriction alleviation protein [Bacteroidaceae bacterium]|nr:Lar family restriction alleviation protein [Bacteroidaceae bacterium]
MGEESIDVQSMIDRIMGRTNELNPCPRCGGRARIADDTGWINNGGRWKYIYCTSCGYSSDRYFWDDREAMIQEWNGVRDDG